MRFFPHSASTEADMFKELNINSIDELFKSISDDNLNPELRLPEPMTEREANDLLFKMSDENKGLDVLSFIGAGCYDHYVPALVDEISGRAEFYTAYTPYQPEVSQGTLQTIYEFQSMMCALTGMDVCNASMYDGATALAEAIIMAFAQKRKSNKVLISSNINPNYKEVIKTYLEGLDLTIEEIPSIEGVLDKDFLKNFTNYKEVCAIVIQNPDFFGNIDKDLKNIAQIAKDNKTLLIGSFNPLTMPVWESPGNIGFDIVTGEAQPFGMYRSFGGPHLGYICTSKKYMRKLPGRIVGMTEDREGKRCFVLTLQAREQHIRRDKATSNICSNQALCATRATVFMELHGKKGLTELALLNMKNSRELLDILKKHGFKKKFDSSFFNEFTVEHDNCDEIYEKLKQKKILLGLPLKDMFDGEYKNSVLVCATEKITKEDLMKIDKALEEVI